MLSTEDSIRKSLLYIMTGKCLNCFWCHDSNDVHMVLVMIMKKSTKIYKMTIDGCGNDYSLIPCSNSWLLFYTWISTISSVDSNNLWYDDIIDDGNDSDNDDDDGDSDEGEGDKDRQNDNHWLWQ